MTQKPHKTLYRYDVKTVDGEDFVDAEAHSALVARYNDLVEQLEAARTDAERELEIAKAHEVEIKNLREQKEAEHEKLIELYAGYSAKCERWSLGTCDNVHPVTLCRICQFFTDLGYESFEVTTGGLRSWRPVKPLDEEALNPAISQPEDPLGYIELDERHNCPHGVHKGLGCRVCDPAKRPG